MQCIFNIIIKRKITMSQKVIGQMAQAVRVIPLMWRDPQGFANGHSYSTAWWADPEGRSSTSNGRQKERENSTTFYFLVFSTSAFKGDVQTTLASRVTARVRVCTAVDSAVLQQPHTSCYSDPNHSARLTDTDQTTLFLVYQSYVIHSHFLILIFNMGGRYSDSWEEKK